MGHDIHSLKMFIRVLRMYFMHTKFIDWICSTGEMYVYVHEPYATNIRSIIVNGYILLIRSIPLRSEWYLVKFKTGSIWI